MSFTKQDIYKALETITEPGEGKSLIENKNIFVGFNRRFYKTISELKSESSRHMGIYSFEAVESLNSKK